MRHRLDPAAAHRAAAVFGRLAAAGLLSAAESRAALGAAAARAAGVDRSGLRARLAHAFGDAFLDRSLRRDQACWRVRQAVTPLLAAWAPAASVLRAAAAAGGDDLEAGEAVAIAAWLAAAQLRRCA